MRMLQTFVNATESDRIIMLEKTNFNLGFLKTIVEVVSDSSVLQVSLVDKALASLGYHCPANVLVNSYTFFHIHLVFKFPAC